MGMVSHLKMVIGSLSAPFHKKTNQYIQLQYRNIFYEGTILEEILFVYAHKTKFEPRIFCEFKSDVYTAWVIFIARFVHVSISSFDDKKVVVLDGTYHKGDTSLPQEVVEGTTFCVCRKSA